MLVKLTDGQVINLINPKSVSRFIDKNPKGVYFGELGGIEFILRLFKYNDDGSSSLEVETETASGMKEVMDFDEKGHCCSIYTNEEITW